MGVDEIHCNLDVWDHAFDDIEKEPYTWLSSELCVPPDPVEDLEWFPNFNDDFLSSCTRFFDQQEPLYQKQQHHYVDFPGTNDDEEELETKAKENPSNGRKHEIEPLLPDHTTKKTTTNHHNRKNGVTSSVNEEKKRCSHCETDQTPLWRNGPLGPKTLCNACGVRYSSGRLLPEYRPAKSPTFDSRKHSNYHRRIVEKRCFGSSKY